MLLKQVFSTAIPTGIHSVSGFKWIQSQKQLTKMSKLRDMWQATQYIVVNQQKKSYGYLACPAIVAMKANKGDKNISNKVRFDSDSKRILIDNCASYSISHDKEDFVGELKPVKRQIKGIGRTLGDVQKGTIIWWIEDDYGCPHKIILPGSLYIPTSPSRLLSPQHWAQVAHDEYPIPNGTHCITYADRIVLKWNQLRYQRTVQLSEEMGNVGKMYSSPGYTAYHSYAQEADSQEESNSQGTEEQSNNENDQESIPHARESANGAHTSKFPIEKSNNLDIFDLKPQKRKSATTTLEEEEQQPDKSLVAQFLNWHYKLNHLSPAKMKSMAAQGLLPHKLINASVPICPACEFGKATQRAWRTKPSKRHQGGKLRVATRPGECISVDQLESTTPGLIAQIKGYLTRKRYRAATVFVDHWSGLSYIHLQKSTNAEETMEAKVAFERYAAKSNIKVRHYHADNGRFGENLFKNEVQKQGQTISFCGVNAHFQNGVAERRIRTLQDQARAILAHAQARWPSAVNAHLWPYAIRMANEIHNSTPMSKAKDGESPAELFHGTKVRPNLNHFYPFGCPVFVLNERMQAGQKIPKWELRARIGLYLGMSTQHARTVALVLKRE